MMRRAEHVMVRHADHVMMRTIFRDRRAIAMLEFALMLPLFLGFVLTAIEFANYIMANNRVQRMAAMSADLVAQSGTGDIGIGEGQIYDLFSAVDLTARPFDLRNDGRIVVTGVQGTDTDNNGTVENRILWQRFDGGYVIARTMDPSVSPSMSPSMSSAGGPSAGQRLAPVTPAALPQASAFTSVRNLLYALEWWFFGGFVLLIWWRWVQEQLAPRETADADEDLPDSVTT